MTLCPATPVCGEVVIDTNCVLDLWVFQDAGMTPLRAALAQGAVRWRATPGMRDELARVLAYPQIVPRLALPGRGAADVLRAFDQFARIEAAALRCAVRCRDPDDQPFIDLAVTHGALLLSKDAAVLGLTRRLRAQGIHVMSKWPPALAE